jgi:CrcB protein
MARIDSGELLAVFAGGVAGALARAALEETWPAAPGHWPWVTFAVNVAGALAIGWLFLRTAGWRYRLLGSGVCGALTTFSTLQLELVRMLQDDRVGLAAGYAAASLAAGLAAVALGRRLA